jgi:hypothetical protein
VLLTLAFLSRTDAAFLLACIGVACIVEWMRTTPRPTLPMMELFGAPAIVVAAYLFYNRARFGGFLQVSGLVKRAELGPVNLTVFALFVLGAAALQRHGMRRVEDPATRAGRFPRTAAFVHRTGWFGAFGILLVGYYLTLQTQVWLWYFCPVVLYGIALLPLAAADFAEEALRSSPKGAAASRALLPVWIVLGAPLVIAFFLTGTQFADPNLRSIQIANAHAGEWMRANTTGADVFAAWDAGALGYFSHRSVVNLDGVVNSREFHTARLAGAEAERRFLACDRVRFIVNHGADVEGEDPDIRAYIRSRYGEAVAADARVVHSVPFLYSGVTAGDAGFDDAGLRHLAVHVYELPAAAYAPGTC